MIVLFYSGRARSCQPPSSASITFLGGPGVGVDVNVRLPRLLEHEALEHREDETAEGFRIHTLRELSSPLRLRQRIAGLPRAEVRLASSSTLSASS